MKNFLLSLCLALSFACGNVDEVTPAVQSAVDDLTGAIVKNDANLMLETWMPERRGELAYKGKTQLEGAQATIDQQRQMFMREFDGKSPRVLKIVPGYDGSLEVVIELNGQPGPKTLNMWRDATTGKVYFAGRYPARVSPAVTAGEATIVFDIRNDWLVKNFSGVNHNMTTGWFTDRVTGFGTDAAHESMGFKGCPTPTASPSCWGVGAHCCNVIHPDMVHSSLQDEPEDSNSFSTYGPGFNAFTVMQCNHASTYAAVGLLVNPLNTSASCTCAGSSYALIQSSPPKPLCCYQSFFGSDIEWESYQNGFQDQPFCNSNFCPGW